MASKKKPYDGDGIEFCFIILDCGYKKFDQMLSLSHGQFSIEYSDVEMRRFGVIILETL